MPCRGAVPRHKDAFGTALDGHVNIKNMSAALRVPLIGTIDSLETFLI